MSGLDLVINGEGAQKSKTVIKLKNNTRTIPLPQTHRVEIRLTVRAYILLQKTIKLTGDGEDRINEHSSESSSIVFEGDVFSKQFMEELPSF